MRLTCIGRGISCSFVNGRLFNFLKNISPCPRQLSSTLIQEGPWKYSTTVPSEDMVSFRIQRCMSSKSKICFGSHYLSCNWWCSFFEQKPRQPTRAMISSTGLSDQTNCNSSFRTREITDHILRQVHPLDAVWLRLVFIHNPHFRSGKVRHSKCRSRNG